jgi:transcriptional regulator GlxA family with amidase domain
MIYSGMVMPENDMTLTETDTSRNRAAPTAIGFLLIPEFPLLSYACAVEPLRAANVLSGRRLYRWHHLSPNGRPVAASNGIVVEPDQSFRSAEALEYLLVCAGGNPAVFRDQATLQWLRRLARRGVRLGGMSGGPYILARAGLLKNYRFTLHWEHAAPFIEEFPDLDIRRCLFEIDRDRLTCGGGSAALDMMHALLAEQHGPDLALAVSGWFLQTQIRAGAMPQRMELPDRTGIVHPVLLKVLAHMEAHVEEPATPDQLARIARLSLRQLERLFRRHLGRTVVQHYLALRLESARQLLRSSTRSVLDVAVSTGFISVSHFARVYRAQFGHPPSQERPAPIPRSLRAGSHP